MMFLLICGAVLITIATCLLLALRKRELEQNSYASHTTVYEQHRTELQADIQRGDLSPEDAHAAENDIVRLIMDDAEREPPALKGNAPLFISVGFILAVLFMVSIVTYLEVGNLDYALGKPTTDPAAPIDETTVIAAIEQLKSRLANDPENPEGWTLLGRTLLATGRYPEAVQALKRANDLVPNSPGLMLQYADALAMAAGGNLTTEAKQLVRQTLHLDPNNIAALWLAGLGAIEDGDKSSALIYLTKARDLTASSGAQTAELDHLIAGISAAGDNPAPTTDPAPIYFKIEISPKIQQKLNGQETLFVFAKTSDKDNAGPPLAVLKSSDPQWPYEASLDRSMSMSPNFSLQPGQLLQVTARLSASGQALSKPGDYVGTSATFEYPDENNNENDPLVVVIEQLVE